jgi:hypothetical protein
MANLTYKPAVPPKRPFKVGDNIQVLDSQHIVVGRQKIVEVGRKLVRTECGRQWTVDGRRWDSERAWPFPSIRLARR